MKMKMGKTEGSMATSKADGDKAEGRAADSGVAMGICNSIPLPGNGWKPEPTR